VSVLFSTVSYKLCGEISPNYGFGALGTEMNWLDFEVETQGHYQTKYWQKSTFEAILSP